MDESTRTVTGRLGLLASTLAVAMVLLLVPPVGASTGGIFVYTGNSPGVTNFTEFAEAADRMLETASTWPSELSDYACVILPANQIAFDESAKAALGSYIDGGGTVLALGENAFLPGTISTMNDLASSLDSGLSLVGALIDSGFHVTEDIVDTPWTTGVDSLQYAAGSELVVEEPAQLLVNYFSGPAMLGAERIGEGLFVLSGDSGLFVTRSNFTGYTEHDNGVLAANLCGEQQADVDVDVLIGELADTVRQMNLNRGIERSMIAKLDRAAESLDADDVDGACGALQDLLNEVDALDGGRHLTAEQAETIRTDVNAIRDELDC